MLPLEYDSMHQVELTHWWFRGRRRVLVDLLRKAVGVQPGPVRILDYGCGTGGNISAYAAYGAVIGIEPDESAVRLAQRRGSAYFCRATGTQIPFGEGTFDVVMASDVLEHIQDDRKAASEIARVLRPGGTAVISVPAHPWLFSSHDMALYHFRRYSKSALRNVLEDCGMRLELLSYWNATLFPAICLQRLLSKRRRSQEPRSDTESSPRPVNEALAALLAGEALILRHMSLPWGLSLVVTAKRV